MSVNDVNLSELIQVFPNPVKDNLTIEATTDVIINEVLIYSINGQVIKKEQNSTSQNITLNNLPNGLCFLQIQTNKGLLNKKIVVE